MKRIASAWLAAALVVGSVGSAQAACDRDCLKGVATTYLSAMVAHDASKAPLAGSFKLVENVKHIDTKAGLWSTASAGAGEFQIFVPDTVAQQVAWIGLLQSGGKPALLGLRLKLDAANKIIEAEHLVVYTLRPDFLANLQKPRKAFAVTVPKPYRDSRSRLLYMAATYYDALDNNNGSLSPFADDCVRFENGMQTARTMIPTGVQGDANAVFGSPGMGCRAQLDTNAFEYITTIDNRRVWIADELTGIAVGFSHFHHSMDAPNKMYRVIGVPGVTMRKVDANPFDMPAMHLFKIWGGEIHEIEAVGVSAPYKSASGWE